MFQNYLKIALRNLLKYKAYSFINIAGLAIGMTCCILIFLFIQDELSYDTYHENAENIYRVVEDQQNEGIVRHLAYTYFPMAPALLTDFPEIEHAVRFFPFSVVVKQGEEKRFQEEGIHIEMCPTSNIKTGSVDHIEAHPVKQARDLNLNFSINTDDPGAFECSMASE